MNMIFIAKNMWMMEFQGRDIENLLKHKENTNLLKEIIERKLNECDGIHWWNS